MSDINFETIFKKDTELVYDKVYVNSVFKRTERVVNGVFYIANSIEDNKTHVEHSVKGLMFECASYISKIAAHTLRHSYMSARTPLARLSSELMHLSSLLTLASSTERVPMSHALIMQHEVDALLDAIEQYRNQEQGTIRNKLSARERGKRSFSMSGIPTPTEVSENGQHTYGSATQNQSSIPDRKSRIKDILRDKGQTGIKDISDVIKDVSEKSIQRDLNDLIISGEVVRLGERRWSTYKLS